METSKIKYFIFDSKAMPFTNLVKNLFTFDFIDSIIDLNRTFVSLEADDAFPQKKIRKLCEKMSCSPVRTELLKLTPQLIAAVRVM